jgi:hypothetical protein
MFPGLTNLKPYQTYANMRGLDKNNLQQVGPIATQNLGGNSQTQQLRSVQNYASTQGAQTFGEGRDITGVGIQGFGTAGDSAGEGMGTTRDALKTLSPAEDYWTKLLSGDQDTMNKALSPIATQSGRNYANVSSQANMNLPKGGYAGVLSASLPQTQAREVNEAAYKLQPAAAAGLNTVANTKNAIAGTQGNIAGVQGQIANWLSSIGIDVSKLGANFLQIAADSLLGTRGQDVAEHGQSMQLAASTAHDAASLAQPWSDQAAKNHGG